MKRWDWRRPGRTSWYLAFRFDILNESNSVQAAVCYVNLADGRWRVSLLRGRNVCARWLILYLANSPVVWRLCGYTKTLYDFSSWDVLTEPCAEVCVLHSSQEEDGGVTTPARCTVHAHGTKVQSVQVQCPVWARPSLSQLGKTVRWRSHLMDCKTFTYVMFFLGRDGSVDIATRYGLDGPGIETRWRWNFPHQSRPALGPTQSPIQRVPGLSRV